MNNNPESAFMDNVVEIDLLALLNALKKHIAVIVIFAVTVALIALAFTAFAVTPMYRTSYTLYVNNRTDTSDLNTVSSADITASRNLATTYAAIITGRTVLMDAAEKCGLQAVKYNRLKELVTAETSSTSEIITVYVQGTSPENALYFARAIAQASGSQISAIIDGSSMRVIDEPYLPEGTYTPHIFRTAAIAGFLGLFAICAFYVIRELMDDAVKDEKALEEKFGVPVLGTIPDFDAANKHKANYAYGEG